MYPLNTPGAWQRLYGRGRTPGLFPSLGAARAESLLLLFPGKNAAGQRLFALSRDNVQALNGSLRLICQVIQSFMSALGHKRTLFTVANNVRFTPESGHLGRGRFMSANDPKRTLSGVLKRSA